MPRKRHTAEQIIGLLRQAEVELAQCRTVGDICRRIAVSEATQPLMLGCAPCPRGFGLQVQSMRCLLGYQPASKGRRPTVRARTRPVAPVPLLLRHGRIDPQHEFVRAQHIGGSDCHAVLQQLGQRVRPAADAIQTSGHRRSTKLAASRQCRLKG